MTREEKAKTAKAGRLRAQADKLCAKSNRLQNRADALYQRADALGAHVSALIDKIDRLYARANCLHGHVVRRKCLKCSGSFGSPAVSIRICATCDTANVGIRNDPCRPPLWNRKPMAVRREEDRLL